MNAISLHHRQKWVMMLAPLVSPSFPDQAAEALTAMLPLLRDFPDAAFSAGSLEAVATTKRRQSTPALDELRAALGAWWRENNPMPRLAGQPNADLPVGRLPPSAEELAAVTASLPAWRKEAAAAAIPELAADRPSPSYLPDRALLERYEAAAREDGPGQPAAAYRAAMLRRKLNHEEHQTHG